MKKGYNLESSKLFQRVLKIGINKSLALQWIGDDIDMVDKDPENEPILIDTIKNYTSEQKAKISYDDAVLNFD